MSITGEQVSGLPAESAFFQQPPAQPDKRYFSDMSRIESGKMQVKEQDCNISELMHNLVTIIQPQAKAKQMQLFIDTFEVTNEDIITDPLKN